MPKTTIISKQPSPEREPPFLRRVCELLGSHFHSNAPPQTIRAELKRSEEEKQSCEEIIKGAHRYDCGKLDVKKKGVVIDENGHRVEAFAFQCGLYVAEQTLYRGIVVTMLSGECHLLLIRSDVTTALNKLFPDIGTAKDWGVLQKCMDRFSPKWSSHRCKVDIQDAYHVAVETGAMDYLQQSGVFQQRDLDILQDMDANKLHMLDLSIVIALYYIFPAQLRPRMLYVVVAKDADDLDEVQRVFKALDFSTGASGLNVPAVMVRSKATLNMWRRSSRFAYIVYNKAQDVNCIFEAMSQTQALNNTLFHEQFPHPPALVGPRIWSNRDCTEIDMRGVRFSDDELRTGRKYIASLIRNRVDLMDTFAKCWKEHTAAQDAALTPYPKLWFQSFYFAVGMSLFSASNAMLDYMGLAQRTNDARLRLRTDRRHRYDMAIEKLKSATTEDPWVYPSKPSTKEKALDLLKKKYDAFLHQKEEGPVLAFTEASLIRCAQLERQEIDDFVSELKQKQLLTHKTHPVTFQEKEQQRFICVNATALTVTGGRGGDGED